MTSGGQCVMTYGTALMPLQSASSQDMHTLEVSLCQPQASQVLLILPNCAGGSAYSNAHFIAGSGPIFLDDVQCTSSSNQLLECYSRPILSHNCIHSADVGVGCEGKYCTSSLFTNQLQGHIAACLVSLVLIRPLSSSLLASLVSSISAMAHGTPMQA